MSRSTSAAATASGVYALGLAMSTVALPLIALHAGFSGTQVGLLVGLPLGVILQYVRFHRSQ